MSLTFLLASEKESLDCKMLEQRCRVAREEINERFVMVSAEARLNTAQWLTVWIADSKELFEQQHSDITHDWLPKFSPQVDKPIESDNSICVVEKDLKLFREALREAVKQQKTEQAGRHENDVKMKAFADARDSLTLIVDDMAVFRSLRNLHEIDYDSTDIIDRFRKDRPHEYHDANTWDYIIMKQLIAYLDHCLSLFGAFLDPVQD